MGKEPTGGPRAVLQGAVQLPDVSPAWAELPRDSLPWWDRRLQETSASLYQLPFYNEPFRQLFFKPRYLLCHVGGKATAFVSILTLAFAGFRVGLIRHGPVSLDGGEGASREAWQALCRWARRERFLFLRVTHSSQKVLQIAGSLEAARRVDAFPLYPEDSEELIVRRMADDRATMGRFSTDARREIRRAGESGYSVEHSADPGDFDAVWPLFESMAARKRINTRPGKFFRELLAGAARAGCGRLYTASFQGKPVQAIVVVRAGNMAYYAAGALAVEALPDKHSPSALLHWRAMRDFFSDGAEFYHLGARAGPVYGFKSKFRPAEIKALPPVTLVTNEPLYALWSKSAMRLGLPAMEKIRRLVQSVGRGRGSAAAAGLQPMSAHTGVIEATEKPV